MRRTSLSLDFGRKGYRRFPSFATRGGGERRASSFGWVGPLSSRVASMLDLSLCSPLRRKGCTIPPLGSSVAGADQSIPWPKSYLPEGKCRNTLSSGRSSVTGCLPQGEYLWLALYPPVPWVPQTQRGVRLKRGLGWGSALDCERKRFLFVRTKGDSAPRGSANHAERRRCEVRTQGRGC